MVAAERPILGTVASRIVAVVTSAGGLDALSQIVGTLPRSFPAAILIVQHLSPAHPSHLCEILRARTALGVRNAAAGDRPRDGTIYLSTPGLHLVIEADGRLALSRLPPLHFCRPSGDQLFASLALGFGTRAIAVVLTGRGCDGAEGAQMIRRAGGHVVVQDTATSLESGMPQAAVHAGPVDQVLPLRDIARALEVLVAPGRAA
jgi:two-component system, chemotaxis family, protein-glutamate methylesterase/glutaminase